MDKELVVLFEAAKKAADAAVVTDGAAPEEARCVDALTRLRDFPVTMSLLVATQVGKRLRVLTKHPRKNIQSVASDVFDIWKNIVIEESSKNAKKNGNLDSKICTKAGNKSPKAEPMKADKIQTTEMRKENVCSPDSVINVNTSETIHIDKNPKQVTNSVTVANKSSTVPSDSPKLTSMVRCNDALRDKLREMIAEALLKVSNEVNEDIIEEVNACDPIRVAVTVESVMYEKLGRSNGAHRVKYRSIMFNLKDGNNPDLRRKVLLGEIKPERLIQMTPEEMASDQRKRENNQIKEKALFECERAGQPKATTDQFKCGRCGQRKTTYYQLQTRSADEPMTTFVTCVNCNNHWKFC